MGSRLEALERWMFDSISHPEGLGAGLAATGTTDLERVILPSKALSAHDRLEIYANAYLWRLLEVMAEEFACVRFVLGEGEFERVVKDYLTRHPSTHYSLQFLGARFPDFLATEATGLERQAFVAEVARLERTIEDVFHADRADPIAADDLLAVRPEDWAGVRFRLVPAHRLLALAHPVDPFFTAFREDRHADLPAPSPSWLLVCRREFSVWRFRLDQPRYTILEAFSTGRTLAEALEACAALPGVEFEALLGQVQGWFKEWTADGLFAGVSVDGGETSG